MFSRGVILGGKAFLLFVVAASLGLHRLMLPETQSEAKKSSGSAPLVIL